MEEAAKMSVSSEDDFPQSKYFSGLSLFCYESFADRMFITNLHLKLFFLILVILKASLVCKMLFSFSCGYTIVFLHLVTDIWIITLSKSPNSWAIRLLLKDSLTIPMLSYYLPSPEDIPFFLLQELFLVLIFAFHLSSEEKIFQLKQEKLEDTQQLLKDSNTATAIYDTNARLIEYNPLFLSLFPSLSLSNTHYLQSMEGSSTLQESLEVSVKLDEGSWDFGEIIVSGTAYLCSGEISRFNSSKVLFLKLFNIQCAYDLKNVTAESKMKSELLRTVSHELRTPLNSIMGLISSAYGYNSQGLGSENLKIASYSCSYLLYLINDLIDYSQIKAGCLRISKSYFLLRPFIKECTDLIQYQASMKSLDLSVVIREDCPERVYTDPFRLKQIILNLLSNSLKFTTRGGIELYVEKQDTALKFTCKDTGVGIDEEKISILFTLFGRDHKNEELNPQGAGLGLYISNILANRLGERPIQVSSLPGFGSQFSFTIKFSPSILKLDSIEEIPEELNDIKLPGTATPQRLVNIMNPLRTPHKRYTTEPPEAIAVLIVDDCCFNTTVFSQMLNKKGFYTHCVYNGKEALEEMANHPGRYDCILLDCEMPVMNGWQTAKVLKNMRNSMEFTKLAAVIGTSAHQSLDIKDKCLKAGMDDVITKPIDADELAAVMMTWINKTRNWKSYNKD